MKTLEPPDDPLLLVKAFARHAPVGLQVFNCRGERLFVNERYIEIFGAPLPDQYCCLTDEKFTSTGEVELIRKAFAGQAAKLPPYWHGQTCVIETNMIPIFSPSGAVSHVMFLYKDISAEVLMRQERDDAKILVQSVLDQTQAIIYIKDLEGRYLFANAEYYRIFSLQPRDVLGKTDADIFGPIGSAEYRKNDLHVLRTGERLEMEETAVHSDGSKHLYFSLKFPLKNASGQTYGVCGISSDITRFRILEKELNRARRLEAIGLLAGGVAHDFNNALGTILLTADTILMSDEQVPANWRKAVESMKRGARSAANLTRQLLAFGHPLDSNQLKELDLAKAARETMKLIQGALGDEFKVRIDFAANLWPVRLDSTHVDQLLANLCFNARDAMSQGGDLCVRLYNSRLPEGDFVTMEVADTGTGIDPGDLDRIFEPFFTTKKENHTGLGLATVFSIVNRAHGRISVDSKPGQGTCFRIHLPRSGGSGVVKLSPPFLDDRPNATLPKS